MASSATRLWYVSYAAGTEFDTHRHPTALLCHVAGGGYTEWAPGRREVGTGRTEIYPEGSRHAVRIGGRGLLLLHVTDPLDQGWRGAVDPLAPGLLRQIAREAERTSNEDDAPDDAGRLHLESLCHELRGGPWSGDRPSRVPAWLRAVVERLRDDFPRSKLLSELAGEVGVHPSHLSRAFRQHLGMTPGAYLRRVRVAAAVRLLREQGLHPSEAALASGFSDQSHMGRWFRRLLGETPGAVALRSD